MGVSLILEKLSSRSSFYEIACFSILASGPHLDANITSENIFRSYLQLRTTYMNASLVFKDFFSRFRIALIVSRLNSGSLWSSFSYGPIFKRSSVKYWTYSEGPSRSNLFPLCC